MAIVLCLVLPIFHVLLHYDMYIYMHVFIFRYVLFVMYVLGINKCHNQAIPGCFSYCSGNQSFSLLACLLYNGPLSIS